MTQITIEAIVACDAELGIGQAGHLPWPSSKADMKMFREVTMGKAVVMGRKTAESIPGQHFPLKGRLNIVLSRTGGRSEEFGAEGADNLIFVTSPEDAIAVAKERGLSLVVIGGEEIYRLFMEQVTILHLSTTPDTHGCDAFFPEINEPAWRVLSEEVLDENWRYHMLVRQSAPNGGWLPALKPAQVYRIDLVIFTDVNPANLPTGEVIRRGLSSEGQIAFIRRDVKAMTQARAQHDPMWPEGKEFILAEEE